MPNVTGGQFLSGSGGSSASALGTLISQQTLGSAAASVTFSSIPQGFTHLKLFVNSAVVTPGLLQANFNGDVTAADYFVNYQTMSFSSTITGNGGFTSAGAIVGSLNTNAGHAEITILAYSSTTLVKGFLGNSLGSLWLNGGGVWNNISPVTSIVLTNTAGGNFNAGSVFSLYGVK